MKISLMVCMCVCCVCVCIRADKGGESIFDVIFADIFNDTGDSLCADI